MKDEWKATEGFSLTYLPFISRAVVDALADFPHLNATVGDGELVVHKFVDLGIAVDLDYQGLLVPVVRDADTKRLRAIAREIYDLAGPGQEPRACRPTRSRAARSPSPTTARPARCSPPPSSTSRRSPSCRPTPSSAGRWWSTCRDGEEGIAIHSVGNLAMSWDHRAFDGAYAASFLVRVKEILETRDWEAEL